MNDLSNMPAPPPLPESYAIPAPVLNKWLALHSDAPISIQLTRSDFDTLFNVLDKSLQAQTSFQTCVTNWSNGDLTAANAWLDDSRRLLIESHNTLRRLFTNIMAQAGQP